uniref:Uncharacterized protein n=1 Tax=Porodaedalea pini TaxID=108901 RepID=A0A5B9RJJ1_9AGAM|nr:hypothetical protein PPIT_000072 [Porodaedalea pini]QEG56955.1 hypothetical protein PPIT_000072 [Porodaedalea pini]
MIKPSGDGKEIVKVKGVKDTIQYSDLKSLLVKDSSFAINQEKWYREINSSQIVVEDEIYTLMVTDNKRTLIYNNKNILTETLPYNLMDNELKSINKDSITDYLPDYFMQ